MPIYDFECADCKKYFEKYLPIEQRNESVQCLLCPSCNTVRLISLPGLLQKGQGNWKVNHSNTGPCSHSGGGCCA
jgi:putative FmdB family regulatory protein